MAKPQPPYARLNQPPRSPNGRNRQSTSKNHSDPLDGAGASAGGANSVITRAQSVTAIHPTFPAGSFNPGVSPNLNLLQAMQDMKQKIMAQAFVLPGGIVHVGIDWATQVVPDPPPIPYTGIRSGEIIGHRAWLVTDTLDLCSLAHYFVWESGRTIEGDINEEIWRDVYSSRPSRFGGVYAYSSFDLLRDDELINIAMSKHKFPYRKQINDPTLGGGLFAKPVRMTDYMLTCDIVTYLGLAYGTVKLWGETVEHEKGYRASFAKLVSIDGFIGVEGFDLEKLMRKYLG